jgi:putative RNA 2'-phosphotransferase
MIDLVALSKALSHALRHEPWQYELELDDEGWAPVEDVLNALRRERAEWGNLEVADLGRVIEKSEKQRHELRDDRIRALYGHSLPGRLTKVRAVPPDVLFHGTAPGAVASIRSSGLQPMGRQFVHLSVDEATAVLVGRRKSREPVILSVASGRAHVAAGIRFYKGNDKVWLADRVPPEFIAEV